MAAHWCEVCNQQKADRGQLCGKVDTRRRRDEGSCRPSGPFTSGREGQRRHCCLQVSDTGPSRSVPVSAVPIASPVCCRLAAASAPVHTALVGTRPSPDSPTDLEYRHRIHGWMGHGNLLTVPYLVKYGTICTHHIYRVLYNTSDSARLLGRQKTDPKRKQGSSRCEQTTSSCSSVLWQVAYNIHAASASW